MHGDKVSVRVASLMKSMRSLTIALRVLTITRELNGAEILRERQARCGLDEKIKASL
jgi:hypothetical protein